MLLLQVPNLSRYIACGVLFLLVVAPASFYQGSVDLYGHSRFLVGWSITDQIVTASLIGTIGYRLIQAKLPRINGLLALVGLTVAFVGTLSLLLSGRGYPYLFLLDQLRFWAVVIILASGLLSEKDVHCVKVSLVVAILIVLIVPFLPWYADQRALIFSQRASTLGMGPNELGAFIALYFPFCVGWSIYGKTRMLKALGWVSTVMGLTCLVYSGSRGGFIGTVAGILAFSIAIRQHLRLYFSNAFIKKVVLIVITTGALGVIVGFFAPESLGLTVVQKFLDPEFQENVSITGLRQS